jgi:fucose 4-O-acetylase-like acetyltransferase
MTQKYRLDFDILRITLTILVIMGHATYYTHATMFGGVNYYSIMDAANIKDAKIHEIVKTITSYIYTFHMPLFFFLSGEVYQYNTENTKFLELIQKKSMRLLVPFILVFAFYYVPIMFLSGYFNKFNIFLYGQIFFPDACYLWFLGALFCCYILHWIIDKYINLKYAKILLVQCLWVFGIIIWKTLGEFAPVGNPFRYFIWFYIGSKWDTVVQSISQCVGKQTQLIIAIVLYIMQIMLWSLSEYVGRGETLVTTISGFLVIPIFAFGIQRISKYVKEDWQPCIRKISSYSFGIYLYSDPLNYLLLYLFFKLFGIEGFSRNILSGVLYFSRIFITALSAMVIVKLLKILKLKYLY